MTAYPRTLLREGPRYWADSTGGRICKKAGGVMLTNGRCSIGEEVYESS